MALTIHLPVEIERTLRLGVADLDRAAKEAMLVELYRQEMLTHYELSQALGLDRFETDAVLKEHHVTEDLPTSRELDADLQRLRQLLNP